MKLSELNNNDKAVITKIQGRGAFRKRITEMGFVKRKEILVVKDAPLQDPVEYKIMNYTVSLRRSEADLIEVVTLEEATKIIKTEYIGTFTDNILKTTAHKKGKTINVALVGNPNAGKTTLFNYATQSKEKVGNFAGVTVDTKKVSFEYQGYTINLYDLPGTYSISAYSKEELYVREQILNNAPDIVVNVLDASNLERNLFLTTQLIDMDIKVIAALNMFDELEDSGAKFNFTTMGKMLGIPFIPTVSSKGRGIHELFNKVIDVFEDKDTIVRHIHINYGKCINKSVSILQNKIWENKHITDKISSRFLALKLLEKDKEIDKLLKSCKNYEDISENSKVEIEKLETEFGEDSETIIADAKYGFISGALKETYTKSNFTRRETTEKIDDILTHKFLGFPLFLFFMWIMFQSTFTIGAYPMQWIDNLVGLISDLAANYLPNGAVKDLIIDGIIGGVGGVIVFLPNILILFFFISLMEDSGYMSRTAFIMDKLMHKIGLHGKSFIPLLMGFGCNVPAIMATRTLENKRDRILTMLINPFMSCSARLPVYLLFVGAFFKHNSGTILFSIYMFGILLAILSALLFNKILMKTQIAPFVMELPPYRVPTLGTSINHMWNKSVEYLKKMGGIILIASIIVWALNYFPRDIDFSQNYEAQIESLNQDKVNLDNNATNYNIELIKITNEIDNIEYAQEGERRTKSYIAQIGKFIQPVMAPLGFDWKMTVSLFSGMAAKEIVVSTLGVLYQVDSNHKNASETLMQKIKEQKYTSGPKAGQLIFTPLVALAFMIFVLIYFPCIATLTAIKRESGSWKWAALVMVYTTGIAWIISFVIYQVGSLF